MNSDVVDSFRDVVMEGDIFTHKDVEYVIDCSDTQARSIINTMLRRGEIERLSRGLYKLVKLLPVTPSKDIPANYAIKGCSSLEEVVSRSRKKGGRW